MTDLKFEVGKYYKMRNGDKALCVRNDTELKFMHCDDDNIFHYNKNGVFIENGNGPYNIIGEWTEPVKHEGWINVYPALCETKEEANKYAYSGRIACIKVEFTEGDGL